MEDGFEVVNLHGCASGVIPTPTIGTNGNWFVGNKDTDVAARGADGAVGEQGPQGLKGDQGEIGPAGPQGIQGIQGEKGEKGEKGDQGIQGETGDQGEKGDQGIRGIQGEKGDQGIQGEKGEQGEQGEKGTDVDPAELARLSGEIDTFEENFGTFKKNFQDGCSTIASAITANGVTTASNASPTVMSTNIGNIRSGGTAVTSDRIISGYTAYAGKNLITGTNGGYTNGYNAGYGAGQAGLRRVKVASDNIIGWNTAKSHTYNIGDYNPVDFILEVTVVKIVSSGPQARDVGISKSYSGGVLTVGFADDDMQLKYNVWVIY